MNNQEENENTKTEVADGDDGFETMTKENKPNSHAENRHGEHNHEHHHENFHFNKDAKKDEKTTAEPKADVDLNKEIETLKAENQKLKDSFLRAYAEAENTKKRCNQEIEKNSKYAISSFAKELLSVADNLQRALASVNDETKIQCEAFIKGVELTQGELTKVFAKFGISKIDSLGKVFDPNFEQVVQEIEDAEKPNGTVVTELQSGYMINDRILREAMVVVSKGGK